MLICQLRHVLSIAFMVLRDNLQSLVKSFLRPADILGKTSTREVMMRRVRQRDWTTWLCTEILIIIKRNFGERDRPTEDNTQLEMQQVTNSQSIHLGEALSPSPKKLQKRNGGHRVGGTEILCFTLSQRCWRRTSLRCTRK